MMSKLSYDQLDHANDCLSSMVLDLQNRLDQANELNKALCQKLDTERGLASAAEQAAVKQEAQAWQLSVNVLQEAVDKYQNDIKIHEETISGLKQCIKLLV